MPNAFDAILPPEITDAAARSGNEWVLPLPQTKEAINLATKHLIAILGVESFRIPLGEGHGYILTASSELEFQSLGRDNA